MKGHTPGVSVLGSDEKCAEHRELRLRANDRFRDCRISTFDKQKLSENAEAVRCLNHRELLIGGRVLNSRRRWQALVFVRVGAAHLVCARTLATRLTDWCAYDDTSRGRKPHSGR